MKGAAEVMTNEQWFGVLGLVLEIIDKSKDKEEVRKSILRIMGKEEKEKKKAAPPRTRK